MTTNPPALEFAERGNAEAEIERRASLSIITLYLTVP